jgi:hypothetical protein
MPRRIYVWAAVLLMACCSFTGCGTNIDNLITALGGVSSAASVAIVTAGALEVSGTIDSQAADQITRYAQAVAEACSQSISELRAEGSAKQKALNVSAIFAAIPRVVLSDYNPRAGAVVAVVQIAIQAFTAQLQTAAKLAPDRPVALSADTHRELERIRTDSLAAAASARGWLSVPAAMGGYHAE